MIQTALENGHKVPRRVTYVPWDRDRPECAALCPRGALVRAGICMIAVAMVQLRTLNCLNAHTPHGKQARLVSIFWWPES